MKNRGDWERYTPETTPPFAPPNTIFWRRVNDGVDWYEWSRLFWEVSQGADQTGVPKVVVSNGHVSCVAEDATMLSLPSAFTLYELEAGEVVPPLNWVLIEGVFQPSPSASVYKIYKTTLWVRLSNDDAETVMAAKALQPAKFRGIWDDAQIIESDSEFFGALKAFLTATLNADKANALLQPET